MRPSEQKNEQRSIVIVSDEEDTRLFLFNLLSTVGVRPRMAETLQQTLTVMGEGKPALVVLDATMSDKEGLRIYRELKGTPRHRDIPVLMLSAVDWETFSLFERFRTEGRDRGLPAPEGFLEKPFEAEEFLDRVERLLCGCPGGKESR